MSIYVTHCRADHDFDELVGEIADKGSVNWTVNPNSVVGDLIVFYVKKPVMSLVATGLISSPPEIKDDESHDYHGDTFAEIGDLTFIHPITLEDLRREFPDWGWPRMPQARVQIPQLYESRFSELLKEDGDWEWDAVSWDSDLESWVFEGAPSDLKGLADKLLLDVKYLQEIERLLASKGQIIFYGPPGTGKTYVAREIAKYYSEEDGFEIVQFHPSYTYEDFVEGYRPHLHNGQPGFDIVPGPLRLIADKARENPESIYVLLIDEINRGNIAKVFGELYFLLEYREEEISLQYNRKEKFSLPENLWLIGTMNTADRSIALLDSALRRRFYFFAFFPDEEPIASLLRRWLESNKPEYCWLAEVVDRVNELLGDRHGAIGPSYFMRDDLDDEWIGTIWKHAILPYLAEQFFGEEDRLKDFDLDLIRKSLNQNTQ